MKRIIAFVLVAAVMVTAFVLPVNSAVVEYKYGDVTKDDIVDVLDATLIQRHLSKDNELVSIEYELADFDNDKDVSILDATTIQRYCADLIENPRGYDDSYLEFYLEIEDVTIEPVQGTPLLANKAIKFILNFDDVYGVSDNERLKYVYTFTGITDDTYRKTHTEDFGYSHIAWSFPSAGIYEFNVEISKAFRSQKYSYTKRFEVLPMYEFDQKRFVNYSNLSNSASDYPIMPEGATAVEYETVVDNRDYYLKDDYGRSSVSERFVALINTKEEYDRLFEVDNTIFTDEFFEMKSLVVAVSPGYDHYDLSPIKGIAYQNDMLYIRVVYGNNSPFDDMSSPTTPMWYSFAAVNKVDVENITSVQRVR